MTNDRRESETLMENESSTSAEGKDMYGSNSLVSAEENWTNCMILWLLWKVVFRIKKKEARSKVFPQCHQHTVLLE